VQFIVFTGSGQGKYDEATRSWFVLVGSFIVLTVAASPIATTFPEISRVWLSRIFLLPYKSKETVSPELVERKYRLPPWHLARNLAQSFRVILVIMMYSGVMPILYLFGAVFCFVVYWVDKWLLLRGCSRPPRYSEEVMLSITHLWPIGAFAHMVFVVMSFSNQSLLPSSWSNWRTTLEQLLQINLQTYEDAMQRWHMAAGNKDQRREMRRQYFHARFLDVARGGAHAATAILICQVSAAMAQEIYLIFLKPIVAPFLDYAWKQFHVWLRKRDVVQRMEAAWREMHVHRGILGKALHLTGGDTRMTALEKTVTEMEGTGLLSSYEMGENPRYRTAHNIIEACNEDAQLMDAGLRQRLARRSRTTAGARAWKDCQSMLRKLLICIIVLTVLFVVCVHGVKGT